MTERTTDRQTRTENRTMANVSHTNPFTGESMGQVFDHGVTIVADGGRDPAREDDESRAEPFDAGAEEDDVSESTDGTDEDESDDDPDVMADVRHQTTDDAAANRVFERGGEHSERDDD